MQNIWILPTAKDILTQPKNFFVKNSKQFDDWKKPLIYLTVFSFLVGIIMMLNNNKFLKAIAEKLEQAGAIPQGSLDVQIGIAGIIVLYLVLVVLVVLSTTLKYWVVHWFTRIFNKKAKFIHSYAVLTYGGTPGWIAMPFFAGTSALVVLALKRSPWWWIGAILLGLAYAFFELYGMYIRVIALSHVQEINTLQAILALYIFGVPVFLIMLLIAEFIVVFTLTLFMVGTGLIAF